MRRFRSGAWRFYRMKTVVLKIDPDAFDDAQLREACEILRSGGLVAFPTETVYGLGANALDPLACRKIYEAKGRPSDNPLIVHISDMDGLENVADKIPDVAVRLAKNFWPGPLTMILKKRGCVPDSVTGGLDTVAVRMPRSQIALSLIRNSCGCVAAPSANISGRPSPTRAEHVAKDLSGRIDMIVDGGAAECGLESTIVDLSAGTPVILRPGCITSGMIEEIAGKIKVDPLAAGARPKEGMKPKAPGMKYRHYAPKGELFIVAGDADEAAAKINSLVKEKESCGKKAAVIAAEETKNRYVCGIVRAAGSRKEEGSIASGLYKVLREMDEIGAEYIYSESFEDDKYGAAIMNRLLKAAAYNMIRV